LEFTFFLFARALSGGQHWISMDRCRAHELDLGQSCLQQPQLKKGRNKIPTSTAASALISYSVEPHLPSPHNPLGVFSLPLSVASPPLAPSLVHHDRQQQEQQQQEQANPPRLSFLSQQAPAGLRFMPCVHVLLDPGASLVPLPELPSAVGRRYTVGVMGLHRSGTHALVEYLRRFFDVDHEPQMVKVKGRVDSGTLNWAGGKQIWKHAVPLGPWDIPESGCNGGPAVVLLTVREVQSWMVSLAKHAYEIFPIAGHKRAQGKLWWMLEPVELRTGSSFANPFQGQTFLSVPELWATYVHGYLAKAMCSGRGPTFVIVRFEDIVQRPAAVVTALEHLGLPRNSELFRPIEESVSIDKKQGNIESSCGHRAAVSAQLDEDTAGQRVAEQGLTNALSKALELHADIARWLGYALPGQTALSS